MAGEFEEPIRLDSLANSIHSGSISFGRFEGEALCWERRSSFSHNRYLEEVEKFSKPGSVIEKKAYFEAHFRKKGFPGQRLPPDNQNEAEYQSGENDITEKTSYDEEINLKNVETRPLHFDDSLIDSIHGNEVSETTTSEPKIGISFDINNKMDCMHQQGETEQVTNAEEVIVSDAANGDRTGVLNMVNNGLFPDCHRTEENTDACLQDQCDSYPKGKILSETELVNPRLVSRAHGEESKIHISSKTSKSSERKKPSKLANNVLLRSMKAETKTSEAVTQGKRLIQKTRTHESDSKCNGIGENKSIGEKSRNRITAKPQSSALRKASNRVTPASGATSQLVKPDSLRFNSRNDDRAGASKEVKVEAEIKQLRKSLDVKSTPLPSFYCGSSRESDKNKAIARKPQTKSPGTGSRVSKTSRLISESRTEKATFVKAPINSTGPPHQTSGATSCHSTVTSDSNPSSPVAETSNSRPPHAQKNILSRENKEKEKEKCRTLQKQKATEDSEMNKGKRIERKQKTRIEQSNYTSSRRGR